MPAKGITLVTVIRTRLDNGTVAIVRATAHDLDIAVDERHITTLGATAIANGLSNAIGRCPRNPHQPPARFTEGR